MPKRYQDPTQRQELEREFHESEDRARDASSLIRQVYASGLFDQAETYHLDALGYLRSKTVLDYGCGVGWSSAILRDLGARVVAFDLSKIRLDEAKSHLSGRDSELPVDLVLCAGEALPFASGSFEAVFGKQILHHLELDHALPEIARVMQPGASAAFLEPLVHNPLLEAYRRLTPRLRSPTEKALSMADLRRIGSHFANWTHEEFCLLSVVPVLIAALTSNRLSLSQAHLWLQKVDRKLLGAFPFLRRYCWQTVIVLCR